MPANEALTCAFLSTYPPTQCGLATFTSSLLNAMVTGDGVTAAGVVRIVEHPEPTPGPEVVHQHRVGSYQSRQRTVELLNGYDVVIIQHEYGIFGPGDGEEILDILDRLTSPAIVVLHTVLLEPSQNQMRILEEVCAAADAVVTMTEAARQRLLDGYKVDTERVVVIAHGAHDHRGPGPALGTAPTILTWGLLGPGKGVEWALDAVALLSDLEPRPRYVVAGQTHPKIVEQSGEAYRLSLVELAGRLGVGERLVLDDDYRDLASLGRLIRSADVVLLPYDSREQVTSGVLIEAVTAGRPVVATAFPHALELLSTGAGIVVPHEDPEAMAAALRRVLTDRALAASMRREAERLAPQMLWSAVAHRYLEVAEQLVAKASIAVA